jgi:hypothetical protein
MIPLMSSCIRSRTFDSITCCISMFFICGGIVPTIWEQNRLKLRWAYYRRRYVGSSMRSPMRFHLCSRIEANLCAFLYETMSALLSNGNEMAVFHFLFQSEQEMAQNHSVSPFVGICSRDWTQAIIRAIIAGNVPDIATIHLFDTFKGANVFDTLSVNI